MTQAIVPKEFLTATPGGLSLLVVSGGTDGDVLTQQADGTYAPETPSGGSYLPLSGGTLTGDLKFTDATYDIGKSGATRPRDGFFSRNVSIGGTLGVTGATTCAAVTTSGNLSTAGDLIVASGSTGIRIVYFAAGVVALYNQAGSDFGRLMLGGTGTSHPAIKRSGTTTAFRLANDSADAPITAEAITASGLMCCGVYTFATVPAASSNTGKFLRISDRAQKHAYSDGTNWRFFGDDAIIS